MRAWAHVDLQEAPGDADDLPVRAFVRGIWDTLALYGTLDLFGVDASIPPDRGGRSLAQRVGAAAVRPDDHAAPTLRRAYVQIAPMGGSGGHTREARDVILESMASFIRTEPAAGMPLNAYPPQAIEHPFFTEDAGFVAAVGLRDWTIDDVGWLVEVAAYSCHESGIEHDVLITVREDRQPAPARE